MAIEQAFCKSWETWDQFDTCDLQFGNVELEPAWFPEGFTAQNGTKAVLVNMALDNEGSNPIVEVYFTEESLDNEVAQHSFEVELIRTEELKELRSQLAKFRALVGNIEGALPSGLESFLDQDEIASYYETGKL
ncbi:hypothetical protein MYO4S_00016 [Serratia phage 4S]|nr:hypothetical protein MYO4S_00016 [Serratia phage 4S]